MQRKRQRNGVKSALSVLLAAACVLGAARESRASAILTDRSQMSPGSQLLSAPNDSDPGAFGVSVPYNGGADVAGFFSATLPLGSSFSPILTGTQGAGFPTHFATDDPVFFTFDQSIVALFTSDDVIEVGTQFQVNSQFDLEAGQFDATIATYDNDSNLIGTHTRTIDFSDDPAPFLGLRNTAGDPFIRYAFFSVANTLPADNPNFVDTVSGGFAINQVSINTTAAVPEPSTYAMFGLGVLALVAFQRKRRADSLI